MNGNPNNIHTVSNTIQTMIDVWYISSYVVFLVFLFMLVPSADGTSCSSVGEGARSAVQKRSLYIILMCLILFCQKEQPQLSYRKTAIRKRRPVQTIFNELGPYYTRRAYRMTEGKFYDLHRNIYKQMKYNIIPPTSSNKKATRNGARNGLIPSMIRLSCAIRYFAGGSPYDIAISHGISVREVYTSV